MRTAQALHKHLSVHLVASAFLSVYDCGRGRSRRRYGRKLSCGQHGGGRLRRDRQRLRRRLLTTRRARGHRRVAGGRPKSRREEWGQLRPLQKSEEAREEAELRPARRRPRPP
jgi:hypothetical protein